MREALEIATKFNTKLSVRFFFRLKNPRKHCKTAEWAIDSEAIKNPRKHCKKQNILKRGM